MRGRSALRLHLLRSILIVLTASAAVALGQSGARSAEAEIIARVNGEAVTRGELKRVQADLLELRRLQGETGSEDPDGRKLERLAVQKLIHRRLLLQEASRRNVTVTGDELDQALTELRSRFGDLASFGAWMQERGLDDRLLFETIRGDILVRRLTRALVEDVRVAEEQMKAYYEEHRESLKTAGEVRLRIIAVRSREEAEEIMSALRGGGNFSRLARQRSLGMRAAQGGDTGWVDPPSLPPPLREAVGTLKPGEAVGPLQKGAEEFLIIGLARRRPVRAKSLAEARPEIERRLLAEKQQEAVKEWLAQQEEKSKIEVLLQPE